MLTNTTVTIERESSAGTDRWDETERAALSTVAAYLPALRNSPATSGQLDGGTRSAADWQFHLEASVDVRVGDQIVDEGTSERFLIRGVEKRLGPSGSTVDHVRVLCERVVGQVNA